MRFFAVLLLMVAGTAAGQVYTWTDENGVTHFGAQPPAGQREEVEIRNTVSSPAETQIESDIIRRARELETRQQEESQQRLRERAQQIRDLEQQVDAGRVDYVCRGVENRLKSANEQWETQQLQGYTISERQYHEQRIRDLERHRDNICR